MIDTAPIRTWFFRNWMYAGLVAALFLLALAPPMAAGWSAALVLIYLQLPAYMLHQVEEHADDRFRRFINTRFGRGCDVLTTMTVVIVNVPCVWGVYLTDIYLARFVAIGLALIGTYAMLLNAVTHVVATVAQRTVNPGLWTALVIFFPLGSRSLLAIVRRRNAARSPRRPPHRHPAPRRDHRAREARVRYGAGPRHLTRATRSGVAQRIDLGS